MYCITYSKFKPPIRSFRKNVFISETTRAIIKIGIIIIFKHFHQLLFTFFFFFFSVFVYEGASCKENVDGAMKRRK